MKVYEATTGPDRQGGAVQDTCVVNMAHVVWFMRLSESRFVFKMVNGDMFFEPLERIEEFREAVYR